MKKIASLVTIGALFFCVASGSQANEYRTAERLLKIASKEISNRNSFEAQAAGRIEVAFSPNEGAENLVIKVINSVTKDSEVPELLILSYSFTSAPVTEAIIRALHRGVSVRIVADYKNNIQEDRSGKAKAALSAIKTAGGDVRTISKFAIHHDKVIIAERKTVQLGSFNYSAAAASRNSENVLVNWDNKDLARIYLKHFERNYKESDAFSTGY